jgi:hypothetical protein
VIKTSFPFILFLILFNGYGNVVLNGNSFTPPETALKDSIDRQILFNGRIWKNQFYGIEGHQFLLSSLFLSGVVTIENQTFENVRLRYDIFNDELLIQKDSNTIIRTNRELISSFDINFNDEYLHFVNFDVTPGRTLKGYYHLLYDSGIKIYVRYSKEILSASITNGLPRFSQINKVFILEKGRYYKLDSKRSFLNLLDNEDEQKMIKKFIRTNYIRVTRKDPSSFRRVVEYYESIVSH